MIIIILISLIPSFPFSLWMWTGGGGGGGSGEWGDSSSPILNSPQNPSLTTQEDAAITNERYTFSVVTSNRYESLVEKNHTIENYFPTQ